jgi:Caspase domain/Bacterial SH3 domain
MMICSRQVHGGVCNFRTDSAQQFMCYCVLKIELWRATMKRMLKIVLATLLLLPLLTFSALAEKRLALVIGNNNYRDIPKLEKAVGDAEAIAAALSKLGYQVTSALDLDRRGLNLALAKLYSSIEPGDTVLVHYSGHGVQIENDNYLLPVDVPAPDDGNAELLKSESIRLLTLIDTLGEKGAGARILIIDACRDNPFAVGGKRSIGGTRGLANVATAKGTFIMYSAGAGQAALDRLGEADTETTSVYTRVLLSRLANPSTKLRDLAASVRDDVEKMGKTVGHEQRPAYYDDLPADFALAPLKADDAATAEQQPAVYVPPAVTAPAKSALAEDQAYKLAEGINTVDGWNVFLGQHPDGVYAPYAKAAREKLVSAAIKPKQQAAIVPPEKKLPAPPTKTADGCKKFGKVRGLDVNGDNFLSVRTGPGTGFTEVDRLYTGNGVSICSQQGKWLRVKYGGGSGWVFGKYVAR